jgi:hypothetical protein
MHALALLKQEIEIIVGNFILGTKFTSLENLLDNLKP